MFLPLLSVGEGVQTPTAIHRGNVSLKIIKIAQRISYPFPCKLLFWETSASFVLIKLRWNPRNSVCFIVFSKRNFVFNDFSTPIFRLFSAAMKILPFGGWVQTHKCRWLTTEGRTL